MTNKMERFTRRSRRVLSLAQEEAERMHSAEIDTGHLLIGLLREGDGIAGRVLTDLDLDVRRVQDLLENLVQPRADDAQLDLSAGTKKVLEFAVDEVRKLNSQEIDTEHLLLGIVRQTDGTAIEILKQLGVSPDKVRSQVLQVLSEKPLPAETPSVGGQQILHSAKADMKRFTQRARRVLSLAQEEAERTQSTEIGTEHLLLGLLREEGGVGGRVLRGLGLSIERIEMVLSKMNLPARSESSGKLDLSSGVKKALELALDETNRMGHHYLGTEHLLLGIVRLTEGRAIEIMRLLDIAPELVRRETRRVMQESPVQPSQAKSPLEYFRSKMLCVKIATEGKPDAEFTLTFEQFEQLFRVTLVTLQKGGTSPLYEAKIGDTQLTITSDDASETGDNPQSDEGNSTT
jgi:ATP-dependent Clp protease ATP-binding subunit ClpA